MFGTDLDTAYFDNTVQSQKQSINHIQSTNTHSHSVEQDALQDKQPIINEQNDYNDGPLIPNIINNHPVPNQNVFMQNDQIIKDLQKELVQQKKMHYSSTSEPLYERYVSKKKDVFKLITISLTVLLGISLHMVLGDMIKNYIEFNDFTYNKECVIKAAYPVCVFFVIWSLKVFNK